ncbi:beta-ketoacyl-ACP synthase III [Streptomyces fuscichromogenes]|uniref:Beta-ketoacyl-[acyl-carrier-protein] synthase III n=1 Tax=Streptomyces fuscichromogenes TaxID=1324013 RepID=A0A917XML9_9ACTN|nr:beta-ketoacyl-ACP synthase III [Streptomyces fuscichromogenes]GGN41015.1 3-oxoacyl-[acyl-carrier-protein] synthase 3 [Streptomyces fuscichromogenes]
MTTPQASQAAVLCGLGAVLPPRVVRNDELCAGLDTTDEWIRSRTGIRERRIAAAEVSTADLAVAAAARALESTGSTDVDAVVLATTTPDHLMPATAPSVAALLGLTGTAAFDVAAVCTGFVYALATAAGLITTRTARTVLVVGADRMSQLPAADDRTTRPLFADGAGAVVLRSGTATEPGALGPMVLGSDGAHRDLLVVPHGGHMQMQGPDLFRHAVDRMSAVTRQAVQLARWRLADVDRIVPHQANARITAAVGRHLAIDADRRVQNIEYVGNTGAASIPLALAQASADGTLQRGHRVCLTAFGAGLTWGATTLTWPDLKPAAHPAHDTPMERT